MRWIALYLLLGFAVLCWEVGLHTLQHWFEDHYDNPGEGEALSSMLGEALLWPISLGVIIPIGFGVFIWRYLLGHHPSPEGEDVS